MQWIAAVVLVLGLVIGNFGVPNVSAQTVDELRQEFERKLNELRQEFERKLKEAVEREVAKVREEKIQQEVRTTVKQALEAQAPQATLGPAPMPPSASGVGLFFNIELSGVDFFGVATEYAVRNFGGGGNIRPVGKWKSVEVDRAFAARPTLGYYLPNGAGILSANFYHVHTDGTDRFSAPGEVVGVAPPEVFDSFGPADSAKARNRVQLNQLELQYQYPIKITSMFGLAPEVGIRGLWFKNNVKSEFFQGSDFFFSLDREAKSSGAGPKIGLTGTWEFLQNFNFLVKGGGGYLLGNTKADHEFCRGVVFSTPGCGRAHNFKLDENRGFPFVEGDFSLNYNTPLRGLSAALGYRLGTFFDLVTQATEVGGVAVQQNVFERKTLTYDSIYFKLQYLW